MQREACEATREQKRRLLGGRGFTYCLVDRNGEGSGKQSWGRQRKGRERLLPITGESSRGVGETAFPPPQPLVL